MRVKQTNLHFFLSLFFLFFLIGQSFGQLQISSTNKNNNPDSLIRNILLGNGVEVVSLTYVGDTSTQFGFFVDPNKSIIGLDTGLIMCTGDVNDLLPGNNIPGGNNPINLPISFADSFDLVNIANDVYNLLNLSNPPIVNDLEDIAVINFEFVPQSDSIEFTYVFGSQEYPQYDNLGNPLNDGFINTQFNDVFGFFISGPGITGPFTSPAKYPGGAQNVAFLPATNPPLPITVSSVHNGNSALPSVPPLNEQYFVPGDTSKVSMRGFTTPLKAQMVLQACDTYNIRLAITDIEDGSFHSAVFLEARSFGSPNVEIAAKPVLYNLNSDGNLYEDCGMVQIGFRRFSQINLPRTLHFTISGTATNGIDYSFLPDSITFLAGQSVANFNLNIISDGITEGVETLIFGLRPDTLNCTIQDSSTLTLRIQDPEELELSDTTIFVDCITDSIIVTNPVVRGVSPISYQWSTGSTQEFIKYLPSSDSTFFVTATDACGNFSDTSQVNVVVGNAPLVLQTTNDSMICTDDSISIEVVVFSGSAIQSFQWSNGKTDRNIFVSPTTDSTFYVTVTDFCDSLNPSVDSVTVFQKTPTISLFSKNDTIDCAETNSQISVQVSGGSAIQNYIWSNGSTSPFAIISGFGKDSTFTVSVTDVCNPTDTVVDSITVFSLNPPLIIATSDTVLQCNQSNVSLSPSIISGSSKQSFIWSTGDTTAAISVNPTDTTTYAVTVTDFCTPTAIAQDSITVFVVSPPLVIQANSDSVSCDTGKIDVEVQILSGNPPFGFNWNNGLSSPMFSTYIQGDTNFIVTITDGCGLVRSDTAEFKYALPIPITVKSADTTIDCPGDSVTLTPLVTGGSPPLNFIWSTGKSGNTLQANPQSDTSFVLQIQDLCPINIKFDTVNINIRQLPNLRAVINDTLIDCLTDSVQLLAKDSGGLPPYLSQWEYKNTVLLQDSAWVTINQAPDTVIYKLEDKCGNQFLDSLFINQNAVDELEVTLPTDTLICNDNPFTLRAKTIGGVAPYNYYWEVNSVENPSITNELNAQIESSSIVYVLVKDRCGTNKSTEAYISVKACELKVSNIFTPNGDGKNDFFVFDGISTENRDENFLPTASLEVFNRWGQLVYKSERYQNNWDGYPVTEGTYYYILTLSSGEVIKGNITLIR